MSIGDDYRLGEQRPHDMYSDPRHEMGRLDRQRHEMEMRTRELEHRAMRERDAHDGRIHGSHRTIDGAEFEYHFNHSRPYKDLIERVESHTDRIIKLSDFNNDLVVLVKKLEFKINELEKQQNDPHALMRRSIDTFKLGKTKEEVNITSGNIVFNNSGKIIERKGTRKWDKI